MKVELETFWKEAVVANYLDVSLGGLEKTTSQLSG
jgi:hypothetical protein